MNQLIIAPQGGLCNRLRAVLSAVSLVAEGHLAADIRVGWSAEAECAARFDQLFLPYDVPQWGEASQSASAPQLTVAPRRWYDRPVTRRNLHWPALVRSLIYAAQYRNTPPPLAELQRQFSAGHHVGVYVSTGEAFCDYSPRYIQRLRLQPHLQERVDRLSRTFDEHTIGVHIRRTDHVTAIAESPDSLFEQAMADAIAADPDVRFFLSTDDEALKARLAARFPQRVSTQPCHGTRADLAGMEEAVVDLWTLARCARIFGSYWSSFTDTAAEIGGTPLNIIRK